MSEDKEAFLSRWSRLKQQERAGDKPTSPPEKKEIETKAEPPAPLPSVDQLTPESDFAPFMDPRVDGETRRSALKKLFADAHFNLPDPFEAYSEDYTGGEPIPLEMLKQLNQARKLLFEETEKTAQSGSGQAERQAPETQPEEPIDGAGKQDA